MSQKREETPTSRHRLINNVILAAKSSLTERANVAVASG